MYGTTTGAVADSKGGNTTSNTRSKFLEGLESAVTTAGAIMEEHEAKQIVDNDAMFKSPEATTTKKLMASSAANHSYPSLEHLSKHKQQQQQQFRVGASGKSKSSRGTSSGSGSGSGGGIVEVESKAEGDISLEVYWYYLKAAGRFTTHTPYI